MWWVGWFDGTALYQEFFELSNLVFCIVCNQVATRYRRLCMLGYNQVYRIVFVEGTANKANLLSNDK